MIPLYEGEVICLKFLVVTTLKPHKEVVNSNINEHTSTLQIPFKIYFMLLPHLQYVQTFSVQCQVVVFCL